MDTNVESCRDRDTHRYRNVDMNLDVDIVIGAGKQF